MEILTTTLTKNVSCIKTDKQSRSLGDLLCLLFEPFFSNGSYGYRPGRSAQQAIRKVKTYAGQGYGHAVEIDLSKYFDTLNQSFF
ncbi:hypothetical protein GCM10010911_71720 [Paenibacillus nasutitermitis]|uniref:Reverse transcriptase domain-containing protein n=1 Tax=Paenibacillus nasutitermitis TaxID=1652958 RepID=A0A917E5R3_9BACL|nr:hypothetical protein GCM10010911_71720 [Paenibacillus nasutitermitis]